jgi:homeobox-leucine zipper protein
MNSLQGRKSLLDLAERMKACFSTVVDFPIASYWNVLTTDFDNIRVMTRTSIGKPGTSSNIVVSAGTSLWLPVLSFQFSRKPKFKK